MRHRSMKLETNEIRPAYFGARFSQGNKERHGIEPLEHHQTSVKLGFFRAKL